MSDLTKESYCEPKVGDTVYCWNDDTGYDWGPLTLVKSYRRGSNVWWKGSDGSRFTTECIASINGVEVSW